MPGRDQVGGAAAPVAELAARHRAVRERIAAAGGDPDAVRVVAVTKGQSLETCRAARAAGLIELGENRVRDALTKMDAMPAASWHLIGHLQLNKVRHASRFALVHSLDTARLAVALASRPAHPPVLLEVNVAREPAKHGVAPGAALELAATVAGWLDLQGLMGMAPLRGDPRPAFRELRRLRDAAEQRLGRALPLLSMGMSDDLEAAVAEGSTMVRVGRALFGPRP